MDTEGFPVHIFENALLSLNRVAAKNIISAEFTGDNALYMSRTIFLQVLYL